jgi:hypothetical protein
LKQPLDISDRGRSPFVIKMPVAARRKSVDRSSSPTKATLKATSSGTAEKKYVNPSWGRTAKLDWFTYLGWTSIMLFCPFLCLYFWLVCDSYKCEISSPLVKIFSVGFSWNSVNQVLISHFPKPTVTSFQIFFGWLVFQGLHVS